ncbi:MAG: DUF4097 family beta strand repeat-containing protein [Candidatus Eiseniibacteriota bacterium]
MRRPACDGPGTAPGPSERAGIALATTLVVLVATLAWSPPAAADFDAQRSIDARILTIANLIGEVTVQGYDGSTFEVEVSVRGEEGTPDQVQIEVREGERAELYVAYPVGRRTRFVYPELGRNSRSEFSIDGDDSLLEERLEAQGARRIRVSGSGRGHEVWADVTVRVPAGREIRVELGVGHLEMQGVAAPVRGQVWSGHVNAADIDGDLLIDTASGHVEARGVRGAVDIDTGSGHVTLSDADGEEIHVDTGSGHVELDRISCRTLDVDTGSGHVEASAVRAERASIDTGSGGVRLALERMGRGPYEIDTGSGGIDLLLPADASARVEAETGSGGIRIRRRDARVLYEDDGEASFELGDGEAHVELETGSGGISISTI